MKQDTFNNIDIKNVTGNKKFWKTVRPNISKKCKTEKCDKILQDDKATANTFINYFTDVTDYLGLKKKTIGLEKPLSKIVENFRSPDSIK